VGGQVAGASMIANPMVQKESLIGGQKITRGWTPNPSPDNSRPELSRWRGGSLISCTAETLTLSRHILLRRTTLRV